MASKLGMEVKREVKTPKLTIKTETKKERQAAMAALIKGVQASSGRIQSYLPTLLNSAMESTVWDWPRDTIRSDGSRASTRRDIVDTGKLKGSLKVSTKFMKTKTVFTISYSAPYASLVHEGGYIRPYGDPSRDTVYLPGRPWITASMEGGVSGIESIDLQAEFLVGIAGKW